MQTFFHLLHSSFYPLSCFLVVYFPQSYNSTADGQNFFSCDFYIFYWTFSTTDIRLQLSAVGRDPEKRAKYMSDHNSKQNEAEQLLVRSYITSTAVY